MRAHNNSRLPSFVLVGLVFALAIVVYSYWNVSTKNSNLLTELDEKLLELKREKERRLGLKNSLDSYDVKLQEYINNLDKEKGASNNHEKSWKNCKSELSKTQLQIEQAKSELTTFETRINEATDIISKLKEREELHAAEQHKCNSELEEEKSAREDEKQQAVSRCDRGLNELRLSILKHVRDVAGVSVIVALQQRGVDTTGVPLEKTEADLERIAQPQPGVDRTKVLQDAAVTGGQQSLGNQQTTASEGLVTRGRPQLGEIAYGQPDPMQGFQYQPMLRASNNNIALPSSTTTAPPPALPTLGSDSFAGRLVRRGEGQVVQQYQRHNSLLDLAAVKASTTTVQPQATSSVASQVTDDADYAEDENDEDEEIGIAAAPAAGKTSKNGDAKEQAAAAAGDKPSPQEQDVDDNGERPQPAAAGGDGEDETAYERPQPAAGDADEKHLSAAAGDERPLPLAAAAGGNDVKDDNGDIDGEERIPPAAAAASDTDDKVDTGDNAGDKPLQLAAAGDGDYGKVKSDTAAEKQNDADDTEVRGRQQQEDEDADLKDDDETKQQQ